MKLNEEPVCNVVIQGNSSSVIDTDYEEPELANKVFTATQIMGHVCLVLNDASTLVGH